MSTQQARQTVLVCTVILMTLSVYRGQAGDGQTYRRLWGTGVVGVALSLLADFAPALAGPFAVLVVLGQLTHGGDAALQNLLGGLTAAGRRGPASPASSGAPGGSPSSTSTKGAVRQ